MHIRVLSSGIFLELYVPCIEWMQGPSNESTQENVW
jgi:hypothetical protein